MMLRIIFVSALLFAGIFVQAQRMNAPAGATSSDSIAHLHDANDQGSSIELRPSQKITLIEDTLLTATKPQLFGKIPPRELPQSWSVYLVYVFGVLLAFVTYAKFRERNTQKKTPASEVFQARLQEVSRQIELLEKQMAEAETQKVELERQRLIAENKNREILKQLETAETTLSNLTLQTIQRSHSFVELEQELKKLASDTDPKKYHRAFSLVHMAKSLEKEWEQFDFYFSDVHRDFTEKLKERSHQLSNYELRMCSLILKGLKNREIAMLLNIEVNSVKMAKYRLKKKFQLRDDIDLQLYFETLASEQDPLKLENEPERKSA